MSPYGFAVKTKWFRAYDADEWIEFYYAGLDYILELNRSGYDFTEFYAATILAKMLTPFEPGYVDLRSPSGIGIAAIVYNYDGDVYASDESRMLAEMGDKTFRIGNVHTDSYEEICCRTRYWVLLRHLSLHLCLCAPTAPSSLFAEQTPYSIMQHRETLWDASRCRRFVSGIWLFFDDSLA